MLIKLDAHLQNFGEAGYLAWIDGSKGMKMAVQAKSPEEATKELLISLRVKLAYMFGIDPASIEQKQFSNEDELQAELSKALIETG